MPMEEATKAFEQLSTDHTQTQTRRSIRILQIASAIFCTALLTRTYIHYTDSSQRYVNAIRRRNLLHSRCDASLSRRRFWRGQFITARKYCLPHHGLHESDGGIASPRTDDLRASWSCLVVGDWGRDGMCCQNDVAYEMAALAEISKPAFIISTGDNFYPGGLTDVSDGQVQRSWTNVYIDPFRALQIRWNILLGNHDYLGNVQAQLDLTSQHTAWNLPARYYFETHASGRVFMAFLDTSCMYYRRDEMKRFASSEGLSIEYKDVQIATLRERLQSSNATWKLVVGHHALYSSCSVARLEEANMRQLRTTLLPIFKEFSVAAYFSGHDHALEHHYVKGFHSFVSGAGSKTGPLSVNGTEDPVFALDRQGFLQIALRYDSDRLVVRFLDLAGSVVHSTTLHWYDVNNFTVLPRSLPST